MQGIRPHIVAVCIEIRERRELLQSVVAGKMNIDPGKVKRFESTEKWSPHTDALVQVYAELDETTAPALWQRAIDRWKQAQAESVPDAHTASDKAAPTGSSRRLQTSVRSGSKERRSQVDGDRRRKSG